MQELIIIYQNLSATHLTYVMVTSFYEGRLINNAHSEIFCRRSKAAMRAQCVLVATTLLHSGAKFHSFLYTGSKKCVLIWSRVMVVCQRD